MGETDGHHQEVQTGDPAQEFDFRLGAEHKDHDEPLVRARRRREPEAELGVGQAHDVRQAPGVREADSLGQADDVARDERLAEPRIR
ncbi:MAG TPA: hypothetical protein VHS27_19265 [Gaiellales bacterium]|jgi:hypothetical protein|nr:hypothetical protein [Gaiellales bacterium]